MSCKSISGLHPDFPVGAVLGVIVGALRCMRLGTKHEARYAKREKSIQDGGRDNR
jgi:hypothetical protein